MCWNWGLVGEIVMRDISKGPVYKVEFVLYSSIHAWLYSLRTKLHNGVLDWVSI